MDKKHHNCQNNRIATREKELLKEKQKKVDRDHEHKLAVWIKEQQYNYTHNLAEMQIPHIKKKWENFCKEYAKYDITPGIQK